MRYEYPGVNWGLCQVNRRIQGINFVDFRMCGHMHNLACWRGLKQSIFGGFISNQDSRVREELSNLLNFLFRPWQIE